MPVAQRQLWASPSFEAPAGMMVYKEPKPFAVFFVCVFTCLCE